MVFDEMVFLGQLGVLVVIQEPRGACTVRKHHAPLIPPFAPFAFFAMSR